MGVSIEGDTTARRKTSKSNYSARLLRRDRNVLVIVRAKKDISDARVEIKVDGEALNELIPINSAQNWDSGLNYSVSVRVIHIGRVLENDSIPIIIQLDKYHDFALEVDLYEN